MSNDILKNVIKKIEQYKYLLIIVAAGILLLLLPSFQSGREKKTEDKPEPFLFSLSEEEQRISRALSGAAGIGRTEVILTLKSTEETIFQSDTNDSSSVSPDQSESGVVTETVLVSTGSGGQEAAVRKRVYPEYRGALVVCDGADSVTVQLKIIGAMRSLTGLPSDKITVLSKKTSK